MEARKFDIGEIVGARTRTGLIGTAKVVAVNTDGSYRIRRFNGVCWGEEETVPGSDLTPNRPMLADRERYESQVPTEDRESTTFTQDFMIAEAFGVAAIKDTYKHAFAGWKHAYKYLTELAMTLNHRIWHWHHKAGESDERTILYDDLWNRLMEWCRTNLKGEELQFFEAVLD